MDVFQRQNIGPQICVTFPFNGDHLSQAQLVVVAMVGERVSASENKNASQPEHAATYGGNGAV